MSKASRRHPKRSLAACRSRVTQSGMPYTCYATKTAMCAAAAQVGKHPGKCRGAAGKSVMTARVRKSTPRRPPGNPIDPCVATRSDFESMSVPQIQAYIKKYAALAGLNTPIYMHTKSGDPKLKADWIDDAMNLGRECARTQVSANANAGDLREMGLLLKYRGVVPPNLGDPTFCGSLSGQKGKMGTWRGRPCKAQFSHMLQNKI